jgi:hypothetical protein
VRIISKESVEVVVSPGFPHYLDLIAGIDVNAHRLCANIMVE